MAQTLALPELVEAPPADDPFRYGHRRVRRRQPDGSEEVLCLPLTLWDVLHPQEEDKLVQSIRHHKEVRYLSSVLEARHAADKHSLVLSDTAIYWDVPGLSHHCPDVALIHDVQNLKDNYNSFHVKWEGVRPSLIIEVVSPHIREIDTEIKLLEYHQALVPLYVIIDREREEDCPTILAFRYTPERYEPIALDDRGGLVLDSLGLRLDTNENRIAFWDVARGKEILGYTALTEALQTARAARLAAEEAARQAQEAQLIAERLRREAEALLPPG